MNKKLVMTKAWDYAKLAAAKHGGKAIEYIAESMKIVWRMYKNMLAKKGGKIIGFQEWFLNKKFKHINAIETIKESVYTIKKETKKAYLIVAKTNQLGHDIINEFWAPKSVCI